MTNDLDDFEQRNLALAEAIKAGAESIGTWGDGQPSVCGPAMPGDYYFWARRGDYAPPWIDDIPSHPERFGMTRQEFDVLRKLIYGGNDAKTT